MKSIRAYCHELQNALGIVSGNVHLLTSGEALAADRDVVDDIVSAMEAAERVGRALSLLARETASAPQWFDPRPLLHDEGRTFSRESGLALELMDSLPGHESLEIRGNPKLLALAFGGMLHQLADGCETRHGVVVRCSRKHMGKTAAAVLECPAGFIPCWFQISIERDVAGTGAASPPMVAVISPLRWAAAGRAVAADMLSVSGGRLWSAAQAKEGMRTVYLRLPARIERKAAPGSESARARTSSSRRARADHSFA